MGFSYAPTAVQTRTGAERATLVKRTYGLVFLSVLVTMAGAAFTFTQPALMQAVAQHYFIGFLCILAPLFLAQRSARVFPTNIAFTFLFALLKASISRPFCTCRKRARLASLGKRGF